MPDPTTDRPDLAAAGVGDLNATFCATLVDEWVRAGVTDAVVCPGLALDADGARPGRPTTACGCTCTTTSGRARSWPSASGRATGRPAVVLTTSGTAAAELHAAVVEADLDRVPLMAVTADRPPELRDVGAPQTIDQTHLFGRSTRWFADPGPPSADGRLRRGAASPPEPSSRRPVRPPGPVHLNLPFREPLVGSALPLPAGRPAGRPVARGPGRGRRAVPRRPAGRGAEVCSWPAPASTTPRPCSPWPRRWAGPSSPTPARGCRVAHPNVVAHADALLRVEVRPRRPEVVVRLGAPPASKVLNQWLADARSGGAPGAGRPRRHVARPAAQRHHRGRGRARGAVPGRRAPSSEPLGGVEGWVERWRAADDAAEAAIAATLAAHDGGHRARRRPSRRRVGARRRCARRVVVDARARPRVVRRLTAWRHGARQPGRQRHRRRRVHGRRRGPRRSARRRC